MSVVVDAAALLCVLLDEPGTDVVLPVLRGAQISAVNVSESCSRGVERGAELDSILRSIRRFELIVVPFDLAGAWLAAELRPLTRHIGVALGDRACMALGHRTGLPIYTGDRRLGSLTGLLGIDIRLIR